VPCRSVRRVLLGSDWGNQATVDAYVLELPAYASLALSVTVNQPSYRTGQVEHAGLAISNPGIAQTVDLLLLSLEPDGDQVWAVTPTGLKAGQLAQPVTVGGLSPRLDLLAPVLTDSAHPDRHTPTGTGAHDQPHVVPRTLP